MSLYNLHVSHNIFFHFEKEISSYSLSSFVVCLSVYLFRCCCCCYSSSNVNSLEISLKHSCWHLCDKVSVKRALNIVFMNVDIIELNYQQAYLSKVLVQEEEKECIDTYLK